VITSTLSIELPSPSSPTRDPEALVADPGSVLTAAEIR
jgi:hypothetical protein